MTDAQTLSRFPAERDVIETARLILRPFTVDDAPQVQKHINNYDVLKGMLTAPYPYDLQMATDWISKQPAGYESGEGMVMALTLRESGALIGAMGIHPDWVHEHAEVGYWIGQAFWGKGYATEAAAALFKYGFEVLNLHRIHASHFTTNPASGRVMEKLGMTYEGLQPGYYKRFGEFKDVIRYGLLRPDWLKQQAS